MLIPVKPYLIKDLAQFKGILTANFRQVNSRLKIDFSTLGFPERISGKIKKWLYQTDFKKSKKLTGVQRFLTGFWHYRLKNSSIFYSQLKNLQNG